MNTLVTDSDFDLNRTENYKLSIQVSLDGFSFSITSPRDNRLMAAGNSNLTFSSENFIGKRFDTWYNKQELLKQKYRETDVYYYSKNFSLVPGQFYDFHRQSSIIENIFGNIHNNSVRDIFIPDEKANLIFTIPNNLINSFEKYFPGKAILHPISELITKLKLDYTEHINNSLTALILLKNSFFLVLFEKGKLLTLNSFSYKHSNDIIYYIVSVLKSMNISCSENVALLSGHVTETDNNFNAISYYFARTEFLKTAVKYDSEIFNKAGLHKIATVI